MVLNKTWKTFSEDNDTFKFYFQGQLREFIEGKDKVAIAPQAKFL